jgi:hypothetical protein
MSGFARQQRAESELQQGFHGIYNLAEDSFEVAVIGPREQL